MLGVPAPPPPPRLGACSCVFPISSVASWNRQEPGRPKGDCTCWTLITHLGTTVLVSASCVIELPILGGLVDLTSPLQLLASFRLVILTSQNMLCSSSRALSRTLIPSCPYCLGVIAQSLLEKPQAVLLGLHSELGELSAKFFHLGGVLALA